MTHNNIQHSTKSSIVKITTTTNQEHILYTIKTQKRVEPAVGESVLKPLNSVSCATSKFLLAP
jgi:hypothetical protein